jgi:hypothetical protein
VNTSNPQSDYAGNFVQFELQKVEATAFVKLWYRMLLHLIILQLYDTRVMLKGVSDEKIHQESMIRPHGLRAVTPSLCHVKYSL